MHTCDAMVCHTGPHDSWPKAARVVTFPDGRKAYFCSGHDIALGRRKVGGDVLDIQSIASADGGK